MTDIAIVARPGRDTLGEGPVWVERLDAVVWVDIVGQAVHRLSLGSRAVSTVLLNEPVGWAIPRRDDDAFVVGLRSGFAFLDLATAQLRAIGAPEPDRPDNRLNDAKVDARGRIWAGSKDDTDRAASGALYRLDPDLTWSRHDDHYGVANGPTFSPDGRILYHTDSAARTVFAFDLAADGSLANKREWLRFDDAWGYPDGMTTDAEGCLWIAHWGGGRISRFSPDARLIRSIALPASNVTSCAFAGPALDRLFVTSSLIDHADEPLAGALFELDPGVCGLAPHEFAG